MANSIDGLISGINTTSIIDSLIKIDHQQVDIYTQQQAAYTNKLTAWQSINSYLLAVKTQADLLTRPSFWNTQSVTSSNEDAIEVSSSEGSSSGTYYISVDQLAQNQQIASQGFSESSAILGTGTVEIRVGSGESKTITLDAGANSLESLKNAINDADAGVTAAIINDGSPNNPYRLILSANETGVSNQITVTTNLSGGQAPDFTSKAFDTVEKLNWDATATSNVTLGTDAAYTGNINKTYKFTVEGSGSQTIGGDPITINWTDGTNSGTITVNSASEQVVLDGTGADGLVLNFSDGTLMGGDTFQVQTQAPVIQAAQDAILRYGATGNGGSPITVTSSTNTVTSLIPGVTLKLKSTSSEVVQITSQNDTSSIVNTMNQFIKSYNDFANFVEKSTDYNSDTEKAGILLGESSIVNIVSNIRSIIIQKVSGLDNSLMRLSDVGIKFNSSGELVMDSSTFTSKLNESFDAVKKLFLATGSSSNTGITYVSSGAKTISNTSGYKVNITTAAKQGVFMSGLIPDPSSTNLLINETNNNIKLKINGISSGTIALDPGTYASGQDLADEIEEKINDDSSLGANEVDVLWVGDGENGHLEIRSTLWGSNSKVELDTEPSASANTILGLSDGSGEVGVDVAGTINGEPATGVGQILSGNEGNSTTDGLKIKVTLTSDQIGEGDEGTLTLTKGYAAIIGGSLEQYTDATTGILSTRAKTIQTQIDNIQKQIDNMEALLEKKREQLYDKFTRMEEALGQLQSQKNALSALFGSLASDSSSSKSSS